MKKLAFLFVFLVACSPYVKKASDTEITARVLLPAQQSIKYSARDSYFLTMGDRRLILSNSLSVSWDKDGIALNGNIYDSDSLLIQGTRSFLVNGVHYRGDLAVYAGKESLELVNHVPLEEYLLSVVPSEVYSSWHNETLKAQSVAARSYALFELKRNRELYPKRNFDLYSDTRSQVYRGVESETKRTSKAVLETKGQVLTYDGQLVKAYFSASVGQISADGSEIGDDQPYLKPVKTYQAKKNPNANWVFNLSLKQLQTTYKTKEISSVQVSKRSSTGRIKEVQIKDKFGKIKTVRGDHFRSKIGAEKMKSTLAKITPINSDKISVQGEGFGHGVGMGQWEAQELAERGLSYRQIVGHFYQNTKLQKIYE